MPPPNERSVLEFLYKCFWGICLINSPSIWHYGGSSVHDKKIIFSILTSNRGEKLRLNIKIMVYNFGGDCDWSWGCPTILKLGEVVHFRHAQSYSWVGHFECSYWKIFANDTFDIFRIDSLCYGELKNVYLNMVQYKLAWPTLSK